MRENRTVGLYTLGCKVSQYETEAIAEAFEAAGFRRAPFSDPCDVYVINTCTVTAESDRKSRQVIRRALQKNPTAVVMVVGCYSQVQPAAVAAIPGVAYVGGTARKLQLPTVAAELLASRPLSPRTDVAPLQGAAYEPMCIRHAPRTRAYVKIQDGCDGRCSYCIIPTARGPVRSAAPQAVLREVTALAQAGVREVVLTGIETAAYGLDLGTYRLIDLLEEIDATGLVDRIRLGSLSPELFTSDWIARAARLRHLTPHFHISMQSGSSAVLRAMRRRYTAQQALQAIEDLRAAIPRLQLTTDMIVGFPGESEENFAQTMDFSRAARFLHMHVFPYSRRPGTPAAELPDVPPAVKHARSAALIALAAGMQTEILTGVVNAGEPLDVLLESRKGGLWVGHTDNFMEVCVAAEGHLQGKYCTVLPRAVQDGRILGDPVSCQSL